MAGPRNGAAREPDVPSDPPYVRDAGYPTRYRDQRFRTGTGPRTHRREAVLLAGLLARGQAGTGPWLDVPAGAGRMSHLLAAPVIQVDRNPRMLAAAASGGRRVCATILALPFAADTFAGALCHRLLQHFPEPNQRIRALAELARVTRGPIVFSYFDARTLQHARRWLRQRVLGRASGRTAVPWGTMRRELAAAGLCALVRRPLRTFVSEQTLVLAARAR